nr:hypothetical protein GCM10020093_051270 [Planobispora longispora]
MFTGVRLTVPPGAVLAVHGPPGTGKTALLLTLAGRMPFDSGLLKVAGHVLPGEAGAVRTRVALAEMPGINDLEESLSVEEHVAERLALLSLRPWVSRAAVTRVMDLMDAAVTAATGAHAVLDRTGLVADVTPLERKILGIALALIGSPSLVVVDDVDSCARRRPAGPVAGAGLAHRPVRDRPPGRPPRRPRRAPAGDRRGQLPGPGRGGRRDPSGAAAPARHDHRPPAPREGPLMLPFPSLPWFELARFRRNRLTRAALVAVAMVPLFYGVLYVWANWDPAGNLRNVRAAVVNLDRPATVTGPDGEKRTVPVGRSLAGS